MALVPYALIRPLLFRMNPESAHDLTLNVIARTQNTMLDIGYRAARVSDPIEVAGLKFPNRVGLAAGLDKNARCIDGLGAMGFGFIEVGTVTPLAQPGNPKPRMFRLPKAHALINRLGFNNDGLPAFIKNVKHSQFFKTRETSPGNTNTFLLGLNIGKNAATPIESAISDYLICLDGVYPYADYVTVNISSPNTKNLRNLQNDEALDGLLLAISDRRASLVKLHGKSIPIFLKIAPDLDDAQIQSIVATLKKYGKNDQGFANNAWGIIATNTTLSRDTVQGVVHANESGGLSGSPVLTMSNRVISQLRAMLGSDFPIIGVGGIMSPQDALSKLRAGANVVQIYSGLIYQGPAMVNETANLIKENLTGMN